MPRKRERERERPLLLLPFWSNSWAIVCPPPPPPLGVIMRGRQQRGKGKCGSSVSMSKRRRCSFAVRADRCQSDDDATCLAPSPLPSSSLVRSPRRAPNPHRLVSGGSFSISFLNRVRRLDVREFAQTLYGSIVKTLITSVHITNIFHGGTVIPGNKLMSYAALTVIRRVLVNFC